MVEDVGPGRRRTFRPRPVPIHKVRSLTTGASMSPREKKTASKNTGPAVTRTSSKGSLRPTKVTVPRIKRALADIGVG